MRPEQVWILDVTQRPALLDVAVQMCARQYVKHYAKSLSESNALAYFSSTVKHCRVLLAMSGNTANSESTVLGTASVRFGNGSSLPLEFMELLKPEGGWQNFSQYEFNPRFAAESCRFAYSEACEGNTDEAVAKRIEVFRLLHNASLLILEQHGYSQLWAVLPIHAAMFFRHYCHVPVEKADGIYLNEDHSNLFDTYPGYWRQGKPGLYRTEFPIQFISSPSNDGVSTSQMAIVARSDEDPVNERS